MTSLGPDNKVHGANMGPIWVRQEGGGGCTGVPVMEDLHKSPHANKCPPIVPFHKDFSPSGKQLEHRKLAYE